jgi:ferric-dicitrate binding protein FerR (iron transport regulator)
MELTKKHKLLITRYLSREISVDEYLELEEWKNQSPENLQLFEEYRTAWELKSVRSADPVIDSAAAWEKINNSIGASEAATVQIMEANHRPAWSKRWYALSGIAALILLFIAFYFYFFQSKPEETLHYVAAATSTEPFLLQDGTKVYTRKGASISYPVTFKDGKRKISFKGNAFFDVAHDPKHPFVIELDDLQIEVLGTSFQVSQHSGVIEVAVLSGKVKLQSKSDPIKELILSKGEVGYLNPEIPSLEKNSFSDMNFMAWKTGELFFDETELSMVFADLESAYEVDIESEMDVSTLKLSARFQNESLEDIFKIMEMLFSLKVNYENDVYIIRSTETKELDKTQQ